MKTNLKKFVESGEVPGYVALVCSDVGTPNERTDVEMAGARTRGGEPLARNSIFRITSMTKPLSAVATLLLVDQDKLGLQDPIEHWLPELKDRRVLAKIDGNLTDTVPARRPVTVEDLLSFRMGFGYPGFSSENYPIVQEYERLGLLGLGPPDLSSPMTPEEWLEKFATLPLMSQPGEVWQYNTAYYVLGIFLTRVTGKPLDALFAELVFGPLGMVDTGFVVPPEKLGRFSDCYWFEDKKRKLHLLDAAANSLWSRKPKFLDASAGLVSTADDYLLFAKMLMNQGIHLGKTFLSARSVRAMTQNQLTPEQRARPVFGPNQWKYHGYGYGVSILTAESEKLRGKVGQYGWNGGFGSSWLNDPQSRLIGIIMCERTFDSPALPPICRQFWSQVYRVQEDTSQGR